MTGMIWLLIKGVRVKKRQHCPGGQWSVIIFNFGTGMRRVFKVKFDTGVDKLVTGKYLEQKFQWIFPSDPTDGMLTTNMSFTREQMNGIYILKIRPDIDVEVTIE